MVPLCKKALDALKLKNAEGFDRILQRLMIDGADILKGPLAILFVL